MKAKAYRAGLFLVMLLVIVAATAAWGLHSRSQGADPAVLSAGDRRSVAAYRYYLREYEGKIGVFRMNETTPYRVLDVYVSTLPSVDQLELRQGVYILDEAKLRVILEDYES